MSNTDKNVTVRSYFSLSVFYLHPKTQTRHKNDNHVNNRKVDVLIDGE